MSRENLSERDLATGGNVIGYVRRDGKKGGILAPIMGYLGLALVASIRRVYTSRWSNKAQRANRRSSILMSNSMIQEGITYGRMK